MTIFAIDFARLYRDHMVAVGGTKTPEDWNARADKMNRKQEMGAYETAFVNHIDFSGCTTLLDVGCGTGNIALAAAPHLEKVFGLDYSSRMLALFMENARLQGLDNVTPIERAWEADWDDVPVCDIAVASRSSAVKDMADALGRLNAKARRRVYLTSLAGGRFIDPRILAAVGRERMPLPDYIYIINILYQMGIHPRLDYIETENRLSGSTDFNTFSGKVAGILGELTPAEEEKLKSWYDADPKRAQQGGEPFRWALVSWEKTI